MIVRWERRRTPAYPIRLQLTQIRNISLQGGRSEAEASRSSALFSITSSSDHLWIVDRCRQTPSDGRSPLVAPGRRWKAPRSDQSRRRWEEPKRFAPPLDRVGCGRRNPLTSMGPSGTRRVALSVNETEREQNRRGRKTRARSDARDPIRVINRQRLFC